METRLELIAATAEIVSAFISRNPTSAADLHSLIQRTMAALASIPDRAQPDVQSEPQKPAIPVTKSIAPDRIACLEDGKVFKSLKRHLRTNHDMTPREYRAKWNLPNDYPMVAPNYSEARSRLAHESGLGRKQRG